MSKRLHSYALLLLLGITGLITRGSPAGPLLPPAAIWDSLIHIEQAPPERMSRQQKLSLLLSLRQAFEKGNFPEDSVYARLLHRIAVFQYATREFGRCVDNTLRAVRINTSGQKGACLPFAVISYNNLGFYYRDWQFYDLALRFFDSAILLARRFPGQERWIKSGRQERSRIFDIKGDYEKCIQEATLGMQLAEDTRDTVFRTAFLKQRAYAEAYAGRYAAAIEDAALDERLSLLTRDTIALAGSLTARALIDQFKGEYDRALDEYRRAIQLEAAKGPSPILAGDYLDQGNLLMEKMGRFREAELSYRKALQTAQQAQDPVNTVGAYIDLNALSHHRQDYAQAILYARQALQTYKVSTSDDLLQNPPFSALAPVQDKQRLLFIFGNKTDDLLQFYRRTKRPEYLSACLRTALLNDSIIAAMRHEQTDEPSKLFWRNKTRGFFSNALEACWLAQDRELAFFFMEKSRAVLLNDRLNELGASALLPPLEARREQQLQLDLVGQEQRLAGMADTSRAYRLQQVQFIQAKDSLERYTRSLEAKAPAYYQYKYADAVPKLSSLQRVLAQGDRCFVHYFIGDSVIYLLGISAREARMFRMPYRNFGQDVADYLRLCADRQQQNTDYAGLARRSHQLYRLLLEPLPWKRGRLLICPDDFFIPFETLSTDSAGRHFLLEDFAFTYVYSTRYLMQATKPQAGDGNFLGIAPALFDARLQVPDLPLSMTACRQAASYYEGADLLTEKDATRQRFLQMAARYSVINIYAHARSNAEDKEPLLYLSDSVIRLSELPLLRQPAAQLIVLSACQTNAGRSAEGEGIYSLARGFAAAGIPAVAATLWQADEQSIYTITADFHRRLAMGMDKDMALRESKLAFIRAGGPDRSLPYFWANMILIGSPRPVSLTQPASYVRWWPEAAVLLLAGLLLVLQLRRSRIHRQHPKS